MPQWPSGSPRQNLVHGASPLWNGVTPLITLAPCTSTIPGGDLSSPSRKMVLHGPSEQEEVAPFETGETAVGADRNECLQGGSHEGMGVLL